MMTFDSKKENVLKPIKISFVEKCIYCFLLLIFFFCFTWCDIDITSIHGMVFLDCLFSGNILHFYSQAIPFHKTPPVYDLGTYLIFGIWELPLFLMNKFFSVTIPVFVRIYWCKLLLAGSFFYASFIIRKICILIDPSGNSERMKIFFLFSPIAVFPVFFIGQYDILYMIPMLMGIVYFIRKKYETCALFFGFAACFKIFPFFLAVPLLLFAEKKRKYLLLDLILCAAPLFAIKFLAFFEHEQAAVEIRTTFFKAMFGRLFFPTITVGIGQVGLFACAFIIICFLALALSYQNEEERIKKGLFFLAASVISIFLFILWHIYWCILLTPFIIFSIIINPRFQRAIFYSSILFSAGTLLYFNESPFSGEIFQCSPFSVCLPKLEAPLSEAQFSMHYLYAHYELMSILSITMIVSALILLLIFALPCWGRLPASQDVNVSKIELWGSFSLLIVLIVIPQSVFYFLAVRTEHSCFAQGTPAVVNYSPTWNKLNMSVGNKLVVNGIHLKSRTFRRPLCLVLRENDGNNSAYIKEIASGEVLHSDILNYTGAKCRLKAIHVKLLSAEENVPSGKIILRLLDDAQQVVGECIVLNLAAQPSEFLSIPVKENKIPVKIEIASSKLILCEKVKLTGSKENRNAEKDLVNYFLEFNDPDR